MTDTNVDLVSRGMELAVRAGPLQDSPLHVRRLVREQTMLCAAPSYLRRNPAPESVSELAAHRWVVYPPHMHRVTVRAKDESFEVPVRGAITTDSAQARLAFVLAGEGIARLPAYDAITPLATGELVRVLPDCQTPPLDIFIVHAPRIGPSARLLRDFLLDSLREGG